MFGNAIFAGVAAVIKRFNGAGYLTIVITNQPVISRGWITPRGIEQLHDILQKRFKRQGAFIDAFYFCPHHPDSTIPKYGIRCSCRKPKNGSVEKAIREFNVDRANSFMVGDALIDIVAGKRSKVPGILVKTGPGHAHLDKYYRHIKPDFVAEGSPRSCEVYL